MNVSCTEDDINTEWRNLQSVLERAVSEALGQRINQGRERKRNCGTFEIEKAVGEKNQAHIPYIQTRTPEIQAEYRRKSSLVKDVIVET